MAQRQRHGQGHRQETPRWPRQPTLSPPRLHHVAASICLAGAGGFVVFITVAASLYPGGTWFDPSHSGYHPLLNFFSDLQRQTALDGRPNPGASWASLAMTSMPVCLLGFWWMLPALAPSAPLSWARRLGLAAMIGIVGITLTPSDSYPVMHGISIAVAGLGSLLASALALIGLRRPAPRLAWLGGAALLAVLANLALYLPHQFAGTPLLRATPVAQKVVAVSVIAWVVSSALALLSRKRKGPS